MAASDQSGGLTERRIRDVRPGPKTAFLWDREVKGLGVRVTPASVKAFVLFYRVGGRKHLATLARCSEISLRESAESRRARPCRGPRRRSGSARASPQGT